MSGLDFPCWDVGSSRVDCPLGRLRVFALAFGFAVLRLPLLAVLGLLVWVAC